MSPAENLYKLLQVDPEAEVGIIEQAYLYLTEKYHPTNESTGDPYKFKRVAVAWETLRDETRRARYNRLLEQHQNPDDADCS